ARATNRFEIGATKSEPNPDEKVWYESFESFTVAPGEYTIVFEIVDLESERSHLEKNRKLTVKSFTGTKLEASTPLFVRYDKNDMATLTPVNFGGNLLFGEDAAVFIQLHSSTLANSPVRVEYSISTQNFLSRDPQVIVSDTIESMQLLRNVSPVKDPDKISYKLAATRSSQTSALLLPLHADKLPLRPFMLDMKIKQGTLETEVHLPFRMLWPEMPKSLRDIDFALDALKYITRGSELDSLRSGPREVRLNHLEEFWKSKDRTPNTAFNEVMEEYYRRVDYAMRSFGSLRGTDGFKTDRGRIYILYGPPSKTERALDPAAGYQEIWTYGKQGKKFVFVDQTKSGNYTLASTQNL
ncbi:MAG: GWxTD domain-containing protein, partial [bacterium]